MLYPLKFKPILKLAIWGGRKLAATGKKPPRNIVPDAKIGESWEISGIDGNISVVANGYLKSNNLQELVEVYMGDLVGDRIYEKYGLEFPVLIKFIDAQEVLSVQVHPNDELAGERHGTRGKTEMWYVVDCEPGAYLYVGFNREIAKEEYLRAVAEKRISELLNRYDVRKGDIYFIPAGTVHAIGPGVMLAEIQETSDITYRIDDWGRTDDDGKPRKLHIAESVGAIDFTYGKEYRHVIASAPNTVRAAINSSYFTANIVNVEGKTVRDHASLDSFVAYVCVEGNLTVATDEGTEKLGKYGSLLIPAETDEATLTGTGKLLEIFMK